jgi:hypothetical protein
VVGQTLQMEMSGIPIFSPCVGYVGFSGTQFSGVPLPPPPPNNTTNATPWKLAIPLDLALLSLHIYLQGLALEFGGTRLATVTNGVDATIGDR